MDSLTATWFAPSCGSLPDPGYLFFSSAAFEFNEGICRFSAGSAPCAYLTLLGPVRPMGEYMGLPGWRLGSCLMNLFEEATVLSVGCHVSEHDPASTKFWFTFRINSSSFCICETWYFRSELLDYGRWSLASSLLSCSSLSTTPLLTFSIVSSTKMASGNKRDLLRSFCEVFTPLMDSEMAPDASGCFYASAPPLEFLKSATPNVICDYFSYTLVYTGSLSILSSSAPFTVLRSLFWYYPDIST